MPACKQGGLVTDLVEADAKRAVHTLPGRRLATATQHVQQPVVAVILIVARAAILRRVAPAIRREPDL